MALVRARLSSLLLTVVGGIGAFLVVLPVVYAVSISFRQPGDIVRRPAVLLPPDPTVVSYIEMWRAFPVAQHLLNSAILSGGTTVITIIVATLAGYGFARFRFPLQDQLMVLILVAQMFPGVATYIPLYQAMRAVGLYNTHLGLIVLYVGFVTPFCTWMLYGYFKTIPRELEEAAWIDGCSATGALLRVVFPLAIPGVAATAVLAMLSAWNEFVFAILFLAGHGGDRQLLRRVLHRLGLDGGGGRRRQPAARHRLRADPAPPHRRAALRRRARLSRQTATRP
jgi:multiple sugar transport system permease protein